VLKQKKFKFDYLVYNSKFIDRLFTDENISINNSLMLLTLKLMKKAIVTTISHKKLYQILLTLYLLKTEKFRKNNFLFSNIFSGQNISIQTKNYFLVESKSTLFALPLREK
jgi:hypothetical protein